MEQLLTTVAPQLGASIVFLAMAVYLFRFLMDMVNKFIGHVIEQNKALQTENKELRQALFAIRDPDAMRLSTALLSRSPKTDIGEG